MFELDNGSRNPGLPVLDPVIGEEEPLRLGERPVVMLIGLVVDHHFTIVPDGSVKVKVVEVSVHLLCEKERGLLCYCMH